MVGESLDPKELSESNDRNLADGSINKFRETYSPDLTKEDI